MEEFLRDVLGRTSAFMATCCSLVSRWLGGITSAVDMQGTSYFVCKILRRCHNYVASSQSRIGRHASARPHSPIQTCALVRTVEVDSDCNPSTVRVGAQARCLMSPGHLLIILGI